MITPDDLEHMTLEEVLLWNLIRAEIHAQQALDLLYGPTALKRGFFYRSRIGGVQSNLMTTVQQELARKRKADKVAQSSPPDFGDSQ